MYTNNCSEQDLIAISDLSKNEIMTILSLAQQFKDGLVKNSLKGKIIAHCFFEASTRTRLSFEAATLRLNGQVIGFTNSLDTSLTAKGESLVDTLRIINGYADCLVIRHPTDGAARLAADVCDIPVINAGDGANEHPSQTLLDLLSIWQTQGTLEGVHLALMGDLKYSRTIHSLIKVAHLFHFRLYFVAPQALQLDHNDVFRLKQHGVRYSFHSNINQVIDKIDCLYLTRIQKERINNNLNISVAENSYKIDAGILSLAKANFKILHPLPRQEELPKEFDDLDCAYYFKQAQNGLYVRQALLDWLINKNG